MGFDVFDVLFRVFFMAFEWIDIVSRGARAVDALPTALFPGERLRAELRSAEIA